MTSLITTLQRGTDRLAMIIGHIIIRITLVLGAAVVTVALGQTLGMSDYTTSAAPAPTTQAPSAEGPAQGAPAPTACEPGPGDLFNPCATLDMGTIDDLRQDTESRCIAADGVMTPQRTCVDAITVWEDEIPRSVLRELRLAGYPRDIDHSDGEVAALRVPAEFVILGGANGEKVLAVDMTRPVTPRLV